MWNYRKLTYIALCLLFSQGIASFCQALPTDFDKDGRSDLTIVGILPNGSLNWKSQNASNGQILDRGTFGVVGNHLSLANWLNSTVPMLGVVSSDSSNTIRWKIIDDKGTVYERGLGKKNDVAIAGADFNGNGIADGAAAALKRGKVVWSLSLDMFSRSADAQTKSQIVFGSNLSKIFYARPQGAKDWLASVSRNGAGRTVITFRDPFSKRTLTTVGYPSIASGPSAPRPFPIHQERGADLLGFSTTNKDKTRFNFYTVKGRRVLTVSIPVVGDSIVGDFTTDPGEEVAIKNAEGTEFFVYNPIRRTSKIIATNKGIAVDSVNINSIQGAAVPTPAPTATVTPAGTPRAGNPNFPGSGTTVSCSKIIDINTLPNVLYKNENIHGGRGRTWLDQGHRMKGVRSIMVAGLNGVVFGCFGLYRCDSPYGCRYYQQMCGDPSDNAQFSGAAIKNGDSSTKAVVTSGNGICYSFTANKMRDGNIIK